MEDIGNGKHVGTTGDKDRQEGRQGETSEGGHTIQDRHTCGDNGRQFGNKTSGRRTHHLGRPWETMGAKASRRRTHHPTLVHTCGERIGNNGGPGETRPREGGHTIQHRHTCGETVGDNGRGQRRQMRDNGLSGTEGVGRGDKTLGRRTHQPKQAHMWADNERQDVRKANAPSNTDTHVGRQWETRRQEGGRNIQHRHTCGKTMGNIVRQGRDKTSRTQTHHPTQAHMWGRDNGGKVETRYRDGGHAGPTNKKETRRETLGGRQRETRSRRTP